MRTLLLVLFSVAWAAVALAVIRALMIAWGYHRRFATATAFAIAAAYVLGAASPWSLGQRGGGSAAPPAAPAAASVHPIGCPSGLKIAKTPGQGHIDTLQVNGTVSDVSKPITVAHTDEVHLGGWVVATNGPAAGLCVLVDGAPAAYEGVYGVDRPDVAAAVGKPEDRGAGFDVRLRLSPGAHVVTVGPAQPDGTLTPVAQPLSVRVR